MRWPLVRRSLLEQAALVVADLHAERDALHAERNALAARLDEAQPGEEPLTPEEAAELWRLFRERRCQHCLGSHARACPRVRELSFHPDAKLARVRFWRDGEWSADGVLWPEDLPPEPGTEASQEAA
jgi:hypothetical protein